MICKEFITAISLLYVVCTAEYSTVTLETTHKINYDTVMLPQNIMGMNFLYFSSTSGYVSIIRYNDTSYFDEIAIPLTVILNQNLYGNVRCLGYHPPGDQWFFFSCFKYLNITFTSDHATRLQITYTAYSANDLNADDQAIKTVSLKSGAMCHRSSVKIDATCKQGLCHMPQWLITYIKPIVGDLFITFYNSTAVKVDIPISTLPSTTIQTLGLLQNMFVNYGYIYVNFTIVPHYPQVVNVKFTFAIPFID
jgi:hypothetical protein